MPNNSGYGSRPVNKNQKIYLEIDSASVRAVKKNLNLIEKTVKNNIELGIKKELKNAVIRMKRRASAPKPYGTTKRTIVARDGRVRDSIGSKTERTKGGIIGIVGSIKGSIFGRFLANIHDQGAIITPRPDGSGKLVWPPPHSPARDADGRQILNYRQANARWRPYIGKRGRLVRQVFASKTGKSILLRLRGAKETVVLFILSDRSKIPARKIISAQDTHIKRSFFKRMEKAVEAGIQLKKISEDI